MAHRTHPRRFPPGAVLVLLLALGASVPAQSIGNVEQLSFQLDGVITPDTEWGSVDLTFPGSTGIQFFNLVLGTNWVVRDQPILSTEGPGVIQTVTVAFDLGVPRGTSLAGTPLTLEWALTPVPTPPPYPVQTSIVQTELLEMSTGSILGLPQLPPAPLFLGGALSPLLIGGAAANANFPNQDVGVDECAPGSVSNSLMFLMNSNPGPCWNGLDLSLNAMKNATNFGPKPAPWNATGAWIDPDPNRPAGERLAWWQSKNQYMLQNGYPVMTTTTNSMAAILQAVAQGKDVEIQGDWHTAAVVGIVDLGFGIYALQVAHDKKQGVAGGQDVDTILYNPATNRFIGSPGFFHGSSFRYAVIEMYVPQKLRVTGTPVPGAYKIQADVSGFAPGKNYHTVFTTNGSDLGNGWWFGLAPTLDEVLIALGTNAPPYNGVTDATGSATWCVFLPFGPLGITLYGVTVTDCLGVVDQASLPICFTI